MGFTRSLGHAAPLALAATLILSACGAPAVERAQDLAAHDLFDPDATLFRDVAEDARGNCVRGELNAKNKMGAYTGFRPFIVDMRSRAVAIMPDEPVLDHGDPMDTYKVRMIRMQIMEAGCAK
jgi:hypothetical protein